MKKLLAVLLLITLLLPSAFAEKPAYEFSKKDFEKTISVYSDDDLLTVLDIVLTQLQTNKYLNKTLLTSINDKLEIAKIQNAKKDEETTKLAAAELKKIYKKLEYKTYFRNADNYKGDKFVIAGRVLQVIKDSDGISLRVGTRRRYHDVVYVFIKEIPDFNIIENDDITIYCTAAGTYTYTTTMNSEITIPFMIADENTPITIK